MIGFTIAMAQAIVNRGLRPMHGKFVLIVQVLRFAKKRFNLPCTTPVTFVLPPVIFLFFMHNFCIFFTTKGTKSTKQVKEQILVINDISFVFFVLFVVENAFVVHLLFLVAASRLWALRG